MALDLKTLGTRSLSAVVFVILLIGSVYWNYYSFSLFFLIVSMIGLGEFYKLSEALGTKPFKITGYLAGFMVYLQGLTLNDLSVDTVQIIQNLSKSFMIVLPFLILAQTLMGEEPDKIKSAVYTIAGILYAVIPFSLLNTVVFYSGEGWGVDYAPKLLLGVIFLIWSNDTFAYLCGSIYGKHKMIPHVSPGKTWEGTISGILITFGLSFLFNRIYPLGNLWMLLGVLVPVLATIGDLVESKLKREAGVKDSGKLMPGHGGVLDRFDSLIFVSPFVYVICSLYFN